MVHHFIVTIDKIELLKIDDWWSPSMLDLEYMAPALLGERTTGRWVRRGDHSVMIANQKRGSQATKLEQELAALAKDVNRVLAAKDRDAPLRTAAAYHLRFENIHPLGEGNGRIGRVILATQLHQSLGIPPEEFLDSLYAQENDYRAVFAAGQPQFMFELLLDLLAQLTGQVIAPESTKLPFSILPLHPDPRPVSKVASQVVRLPQKK